MLLLAAAPAAVAAAAVAACCFLLLLAGLPVLLACYWSAAGFAGACCFAALPLLLLLLLPAADCFCLLLCCFWLVGVAAFVGAGCCLDCEICPELSPDVGNTYTLNPPWQGVHLNYLMTDSLPFFRSCGISCRRGWMGPEDGWNWDQLQVCIFGDPPSMGRRVALRIR